MERIARSSSRSVPRGMGVRCGVASGLKAIFFPFKRGAAITIGDKMRAFFRIGVVTEISVTCAEVL